jgi:hypothetical protein
MRPTNVRAGRWPPDTTAEHPAWRRRPYEFSSDDYPRATLLLIPIQRGEARQCPPRPSLAVAEALDLGYLVDNLQTRLLCGIVPPFDLLPAGALDRAKRMRAERFLQVDRVRSGCLTPSSRTSIDPTDAMTGAAGFFKQPRLSPVQERAVESLREDGIAVLRFVDLLGEELWREANADISPFVRKTEDAVRDAGDKPDGKEDFIVRRFFQHAGAHGDREEVPTFGFDDPWLRIGASAAVLDVVNSYYGCMAKLSYLDNWFTVPYAGADERISSQRWHRDGDDEHVVKVFVYFSDVDEDAGPFEYVRGSPEGMRHGDIWPWHRKHKLRYPPPGELESALPAQDFLTATGPSGTMIICDTGGFHRGGFARTKPRVSSISVYVQTAKGKPRFSVSNDSRSAALPQVRFALE